MFMSLMDAVKLDRTGIREKLESEINRYHKFRSGVLGIKEKDGEKSKDVDIRNYAKYILKEGEVFEKRELLSCMRSKLVLKNKELRIEG